MRMRYIHQCMFVGLVGLRESMYLGLRLFIRVRIGVLVCALVH